MLHYAQGDEIMTPRLGKPAPDFVLKNQDGTEIRLSQYRGRNVVLAFFPLAWTPV
jgi:peroxiredoxin